MKGAEPGATRLVGYFALSYAVTWACWLPIVVWDVPANRTLGGGLWLLGVFAPALVAVTLTAWNDGATDVRILLGHVLQWRIGAPWYLFAMAYMAAIKLCVAGLHRVITGAWPPFGQESVGIILLAMVLSTPVQSGEEIGWRGYALPRLAERMGFAKASLLLGLLWACWHLPQFFVRQADTYQQSFPIWVLQVMAISVALAWLYTHTKGSLLLVMLMHSAINNTKDIVPSRLAGAHHVFSVHASVVMYLTTALLWVGAVYFLARMPRRPGRDAPVPKAAAT